MSGWCCITVDASSEEDGETLGEFLRNHSESVERVDGGKTMTALIWGYDGNDIARGFLKRNTDKWERAVVMACNDTTDAGNGAAYEVQDGSMERADQSYGVESARGHDAADDLSEFVDARIFMR